MEFYREMQEMNEQAENIYTEVTNVLSFKKRGLMQSNHLGDLTLEQLRSAVGSLMVYRNSVNFYFRQYQELLESASVQDNVARTTIFLETKILIEKMTELLDPNCIFYTEFYK